MPETLVAPEQNQRQEITVDSQNLAGSMFGIEMPKVEEEKNEVKTEEKKEAVTVEKVEPKFEVTKEETKPTWINDFGWENEDAAKSEITELRKLKDQVPQERKYENEDSKKVHQLLLDGKIDDVLNIYSKQKSIEKVIGLSVNKDTAADIIKLNLELKHPTLTKEQIEFQYRQEYGIPKEPIQKADELDEDFSERQQAWKDQVTNIQMKTEIAATMAKPELEAAKVKLVLPNIEKQTEQQPQLTQEDLDAAKKFDDAFIQSVDSSMKNFNGVSVPVKNEVVDFTVEYGTSDEEKAAVASVMKEFAMANYNSNALLAERWVNKDGSLKTEQMIKDYHLLSNAEKIHQKIATDSANKAIESYVKGKKNINVNETSQPGTAQITKEDKTEMDVVRDQFFG